MSVETDRYRAFIDRCAEMAGWSVLSDRVISRAWANHEPPDGEISDFLSTLDERQLRLIAYLMKNDRRSGVHDVLAYLNEYTLRCEDGVTLPYRPFYNLNHVDLVTRLDGVAWEKIIGEDEVPDSPPSSE